MRLRRRYSFYSFLQIIFSSSIFLGPPLSQYAYYAAILVGAVRLMASLSLTSLLVRFKRRHLYLASAVATVCSLAVFGTTLLFATHLEHWHLEEQAVIIMNMMGSVVKSVLYKLLSVRGKKR